jgi:hypothetical protein
MNACVRRLVVVGLLGLSAAGPAGCGSDRPKTAVVKGKVTFNGKPVPHGTVLFVPVTPGTSATGEIGPDGTYSLTTFKKGDGALLGKHKVVVVAMDEKPGAPPVEGYLPPPIVPDKYSSPGTTDLEAEVREGENKMDFDLKGALYKPRRGRPEPPPARRR